MGHKRTKAEKRAGPMPAAVASPQPRWAPYWQTALAMAIVAIAAVATYSNSFGGPFILDDLSSIADNPTIQHLWPISTVLSPPSVGETVGGRPLLNLSLAMNYAAGGRLVWGYHFVNLAIHVLAAWLLFAVVRRTLTLDALRQRWGNASIWLALAIALLWTVHPLQTESVTYVVQRAESLVALFYLLTLYCTIRGARSSHPWPWYAGAILACVLGMATKEVMLTAPIVVLLYDRALLGGSFAEAFRRRWGLFLGLAATWILLAWLVVSSSQLGHRTDAELPGAWSYALTQPGVILHYLKLCVWPDRLCVFYRWPVAASTIQIVPGLLLLGLLGIATVWGLIRNRAWAVASASFFLILAPSSSFVPLADLAFEHRMYLPLSIVIALVVLGGYALCQAILRRDILSAPTIYAAAIGLVGVTSLGLGIVSHARNTDYSSAIAIWEDTVAKRPENVRAQVNLGEVFEQARRPDDAIAAYRAAIALQPNLGEAHCNLANVLARRGQVDEAFDHYERALKIDSRSAVAHSSLAGLLVDLRKDDAAIRHCREALSIDPQCVTAYVNLGAILNRQGKAKEAIEQYEKALAIKELPDAHFNLAVVLAHLYRTSEAIEHFQRAVDLNPNDIEARTRLLDAQAVTLAQAGRSREALETANRALRMATAQGNTALADAIRARMRLYQANPVHP